MSNASRIRTGLALAGATFAFALASLPAAEARSPRGGPHYQDHRPGTPIVDNNGNRLGTLHPGQTRSDLGWSGNHPRGSGNPYMPGSSAPGHYQDHRGDQAGHPIVQPGRPRSPGGGVFPAPPVPPGHVQDHRGDRGGIPIVGQPRPGRPRATTPVLDPGIGNGGSAGGRGHNHGNPGRAPIFTSATFEANTACTYEWRRINGQRRQVKVCAAD